MSTLDLRVAHLLDGSGLTAAQREEQLVAAVALLRAVEAGGSAKPETAAPENFLLCSEVALTLDVVGKPAVLELARSCVEHFLRSRPPRTQFLVRAYFALGSVQAAEAAPCKLE